MKRILFLLGLALGWAGADPVRAEFKAGAAVVDVTPERLPVLVNGGMYTRSVGKVKTRVHARAIVLEDGRERVGIVVVDSCMMPRPLLDEAKALASARTGIATNRILISATHAHSAPSSMGCLGTDADPAYVPVLRDRLVEVLAAARANLEPARIGFARADAAEFTALRQWIRRPDRIGEDPFGNRTVRADMHAGRNWDDVTGEAGPEDPDLSLISLQAVDGRPLAVLGNFSMHYFGDNDLSADYFGLFSEGLKARLAPADREGKPPFVGIMSHGCSGDIYRVDYTIPESRRNSKQTIEEYANGLLDLAEKAQAGIVHRADVDLAMAEQRFTLKYRVPDRQRLEWAQRIVAAMGNRAATNTTEVYAREQIFLHERQETEVVVQALRIGEIAIASLPTETYAITGLKIKAASPLAATMVIELANGGDGYVPPLQQHLFGGYNTWPARSAGLEVLAEPRLAEAAVLLLERTTGRPRRRHELSRGPAAQAIVDLKPMAWWRLDEFEGPEAADASGRGHGAIYETEATYFLEGPSSARFGVGGEKNRSVHLVGGRVRARLAGLGAAHSVSLWVWNGMPNDGRDVSGWLVSRGHDNGLGAGGIHLGVGGRRAHTGRLILLQGDNPETIRAGRTEIPRWEWRHVALVRDGTVVRVYLDGVLEIETGVRGRAGDGIEQWFFGGRSDNDSNWEGRLDEVAVFDRALTAAEVSVLAGR